MTRVETVADILRDAIRTRGLNWEEAAQEVLDYVDTETEFEYRIARRWRDDEDFHEVGPWYDDLAEIQDVLRRNVDINIHHKTGTEFKLVKRIAHGPVIDA